MWIVSWWGWGTCFSVVRGLFDTQFMVGMLLLLRVPCFVSFLTLHAFPCLLGPPSVRGCSASELCSILPRSTCLRLILLCTCPPLCAGGCGRCPPGSGVMSDLFFCVFFLCRASVGPLMRSLCNTKGGAWRGSKPQNAGCSPGMSDRCGTHDPHTCAHTYIPAARASVEVGTEVGQNVPCRDPGASMGVRYPLCHLPTCICSPWQCRVLLFLYLCCSCPCARHVQQVGQWRKLGHADQPDFDERIGAAVLTTHGCHCSSHLGIMQ